MTVTKKPAAILPPTAAEKKEQTELVEYAKNPAIGIKPDTLEAYAHQHSFKINPKGHVKSNKEAIRKIQKKYKKNMESAEAQNDLMLQNDLYELASKEILEIGLLNFSYDNWAENEDVGPTVLGQLATELAYFLMVQGGKAGYQHWLMQQKLVTNLQ